MMVGDSGSTPYGFDACTVVVIDPPWERHLRRVETLFKDETMSAAWPQWGDPGHLAASWHCGYGGDQWAMMKEHELAHAFLAEYMGHPYSYSVWSHAHGTAKDTLADASDRVKEEEHLVTSFQRFINTGYLDDYDLLRKRLGGTHGLSNAAQNFLLLCRPWLWGRAV